MFSSFVLSIVYCSWCSEWTYNTACIHAFVETENKKTISQSYDWTKRNQRLFAAFSDNNWFQNHLLVGSWRNFSRKFRWKWNTFHSVDKTYLNISKNRARYVFAGCFFHFAQANWREVQDLGLKKAYFRYLFTTVDLISLRRNFVHFVCKAMP